MKLEEGMYIRTKAGYIAKILGIDYRFEGDGNDLNNIDAIFFDKSVDEIGKDIYSTCFYIFKEAKTSHNIIDLIEVGDYVNGKQVIDKFEEPSGVFAGQIFIRLDGEDAVPTMRNIETIVTKEQFESMSYKVGD